MRRAHPHQRARGRRATPPFTGTLRIVAGAIEAVERGRVPRSGRVDLDGDFLLPGLVELHTDMLEKHAGTPPRCPLAGLRRRRRPRRAARGRGHHHGARRPRGRLRDRQPRAAARPAALRRGHARTAQSRGLLRVEHFLHMRCEVSTEYVLDDFEPFAEDPLVRLVSLMDHTPGQRQFVTWTKYREYNQGKYGLSDAEIAALIAKRREDQARVRRAASRGHRPALPQARAADGQPRRCHHCATSRRRCRPGVVIAEFPTTVEAARAARAYLAIRVAGAPNLVLRPLALGQRLGGRAGRARAPRYPLVRLRAGERAPRRLHAPSAGRSVARGGRDGDGNAGPSRGLNDRGEIAPGRRADLVRVRVADGLPVVQSVWRAGRRVA